jgi:hypothetical protein
VTIGRWDGFDALLGGPAGAGAVAPLRDRDEFKRALAQVHAAPVVVGYVDVEATMALVGQVVQMQGDEDAMIRWPQFRDALHGAA